MHPFDNGFLDPNPETFGAHTAASKLKKARKLRAKAAAPMKVDTRAFALAALVITVSAGIVLGEASSTTLLSPTAQVHVYADEFATQSTQVDTVEVDTPQVEVVKRPSTNDDLASLMVEAFDKAKQSLIDEGLDLDGMIAAAAQRLEGQWGTPVAHGAELPRDEEVSSRRS